jgi:hypothetical protein
MDFYNTEIKCNYRDFNDEKESDLIYKKNLIEIFNLQDNILSDELFEIMSESIEKLRDYLLSKSYYQKIQNLAIKTSSLFIFEDEKTGFMLLYSYDFCDKFHNLICNIINNDDIPEEQYDELLNLVSKNK